MNTNVIDLTGKQILVTGASSGIGRETAKLVSRLGGSVIVSGRNEAELAKTISMMEPGPHSISIFDLNQIDEIADWLADLNQKVGKLDGLANLAGVYAAKPLRVVDSKLAHELFNLNVLSTIALVRGFRHRKIRNETSSIVLIASVAALIGEAGISTYSATKGAIISLTKSLAAELANESIRINCISPSLVKTELFDRMNSFFTDEQIKRVEKSHPLGLGQPVDVANLIVFLLSSASKWMTGSNLTIDGGYSLR
ncbi:MAG: SDR family oxidoreductase [Pirellulaceae bacterium]